MVSREKLEHNQIWIYAIALVIAAIAGIMMPETTSLLDNHVLISIIIAGLMFGMFTQIPFLSIKESMGNPRFIYALLVANYVAVPLVVWLLTQFLPQEQPSLLLGVYLVLLTPCIDYVIVFTFLGKGNEKAMLLATPILFVTQMIFLPAYLWIFMGKQTAELVKPGPFIEAFLIIILLPLLLAILTQVLAKKGFNPVLEASAWLPVPLMALTLFVIVASQMSKLSSYADTIVKVIPIYLAFMIIMPVITRLIVKYFSLDIRSGRAVVFSAGTRNSLVVLPLALSLPDQWSSLVAAIIVTQTIVELVGELIYIRLVPRFVLPDKSLEQNSG